MTRNNDGDPQGTQRPPAIQALDQLPVGPAPVAEVLGTGRAIRRRRAATIASVAAAACLVVTAGLVATRTDTGETSEAPLATDAASSTAPNGAGGYGLVVDAVVPHGSSPVTYFEGALEEVRLLRDQDGKLATVKSQTAEAPWTEAWTGLPAGEYTISAAVRPCSGNCDVLDRPTDRCEQAIDLGADLKVEVRFNAFAPCEITIAEDIAPTPPSPPAAPPGPVTDLPVSVRRSREVGDFVIPLIRGAAVWVADRGALIYLSPTTYDSCLTRAEASTEGSTEGSTVTLRLDPTIGTPPQVGCQDIASQALITIMGLNEPPATLTVVEEGRSRTVPVDDPYANPEDPTYAPAVWTLSPGQDITPETTSFEASVQRVSCNEADAVDIFEPAILYGAAAITVTFQADGTDLGRDCLTLHRVQVSVTLSDPLGRRSLIDGQCSPNAANAVKSVCDDPRMGVVRPAP